MVGVHIYKIKIIIITLFLSQKVLASEYIYSPGVGLLFAWQSEEKVGITTGNVNAGTMEQLRFWTSSTAGDAATERGLYAVGYKLKTSTTYYSYSPYRWTADFDAHAITCNYDGQTQNGNASTASLSAYDYQMAAATTTASACTFNFKRIGSIIRLSFRSPEAMTITKVSLTTETPAIATTATMDITSQTVALGGWSSAVTLTTENLSVSEGAVVTVYLALPAQDLSASNIDITMTDGNGKTMMLAKIGGLTMKAGYLYEIPLADATVSYARWNAPLYPSATSRASSDGISNPTARSSHILTDNDYEPNIISLPGSDTGGTETGIREQEQKNNDNDAYYTLDGKKAVSTNRRNIYIYKGKKIIR